MTGLLILLLVTASCIWVHHDARELTARAATEGSRARIAAARWVVGCLFMWIIIFPAYLIRRAFFKRAHNLA
jgi:hypothetical protein